MISKREWISFGLALIVIALTQGNLALGIVAFLAAWMVQIPHPDNRSPERRYRMRMTERRNKMVKMWRESGYDRKEW